MSTYYTKDHEWVRVDGSTATVGITNFAQEQLGDVVFVGQTLDGGAEFTEFSAIVASRRDQSVNSCCAGFGDAFDFCGILHRRLDGESVSALNGTIDAGSDLVSRPFDEN